MSSVALKTIYLSEYTPPSFVIDKVKLHFELGEAQTVVTTAMNMRRGGGEGGPLRLDGRQLLLSLVKLDGRMLAEEEYQVDEESLTIHGVADVFVLELQTIIKPQENTSLDGLYKSSGNFCTQCEAQGFRKITYSLDRPDVMTLFTTTIVADKERYPVLLSNGNLVAQAELGDGRHSATWQDPFKKPCYLFALVAGQLEFVESNYTTMSGRDVALRIYVERHNLDKCDHAMQSLKRAMRWDEQVYGREYDLDIYMIVAVDDFNMGAMENKGLNVFNSKYVLARPDTATDADFIGIESVIAHEYFHNWSGNRVTCRDWFQLSLKEGFTVFRDQEFTSDLFSRAVKRIDDVNRLRSHQFAEDGGPMSHPVRPESYVEINNFYTLTVYEKGAEVVRMLSHLVGATGFRRGSDLYFERHDGQAVTTEDFVRAMEDANFIDLSQFKRWYSQSGTPVLDCSSEYDAAAQSLTLTIRQSCPATPGQPTKQPFHIPVEVGLLAPDGTDYPLQLRGEPEAMGRSRVLECRDEVQSFQFINIAQPPVPSLLRQFSAPVKLHYNYSNEALAFLMAHDSDSFNRWNANQQLALGLLHGLIEQKARGGEFDLAALGDGYGLYSHAFGQILAEQGGDLNLKAMAMGLPTENYISETMSVVDPVAVHEARWLLRSALTRDHEALLCQNYEDHLEQGNYNVKAESIGRRAVKNSCLGLLATLENSAVIQLCYAQFSSAGNMTDVMAALRCLTDIDCDKRLHALELFYDKWRGEPLVVDKWLGLQAMSRLPQTLKQIKQLMQHPAFTLKNPNKVRALISTFVNANPYRFHTPAGYTFLADQVVVLDGVNPQVAARLAAPLIQWRRFDEARQQLMRAELERILAAPNLSRDTREVVSKGLA